MEPRIKMRLPQPPTRLVRGPALLALTLPLAVALAFSDETLDKVPKSEGYCSRILRAQGTRREGYTEFSLRVEGDPDFYKPGTSYRGMLESRVAWGGMEWGTRDPSRRAPAAQCRRRAHGPRAHGPGEHGTGAAGTGPGVPAALSPYGPELGANSEPVCGAVAAAAARRSYLLLVF